MRGEDLNRLELPRFRALGDADCPRGAKSDRVEARNKCIGALIVHAGKEADPIGTLIGNVPQVVSCRTLSVAVKPG